MRKLMEEYRREIDALTERITVLQACRGTMEAQSPEWVRMNERISGLEVLRRDMMLSVAEIENRRELPEWGRSGR